VNDTLAQMASETDFRERAWIEAASPPYERENGPGRVTFTQSLQSFAIDATMERDGWLVVSVPAWKDWRASVDGRRVKTQFANHAFLGIHVPTGRHRVELTFLPRGFVVGRAISGLTLLLIAAMACARAKRERHPP
jgi:uncharacterized membrane protein YfhO